MDNETNELGRAPAGQATHEPSPAVSALTGECPSREHLERRIADVRLVLAGYFNGAVKRGEACEHGRYYYEDCIACYDIAIEAAIDGRPQSKTVDGRAYERALGIAAGTGETQGGSTA